MTTVITRYFDSAKAAHSAIEELVYRERVPRGIIGLHETAEGLGKLVGAGRMSAETAEAYSGRLASGGAVVVVSAGYRPLGVAKITRTRLAELGAADLGELSQETRVKDDPKPGLTIMQGSPHIMTRRLDSRRSHHYMADWPIPLLRRGKPFQGAVFSKHARMADFPLPLISKRKPYSDMIYVDKHQRMAGWPIAHLVPGHKFQAGRPIAHLLPGHKHQAGFPFGHLVPGHKLQAGWPIKHLVPGHPRMASVPFPLLINGKQGGNALIPGHKFMAKFPFAHLIPGHKHQANFPIGLLVPGNKYQAKFPFGHIVPGHKFMAKFPFGHIVPGHKFMAKFPFAHLVPGHKRMANWPIPLLSKR